MIEESRLPHPQRGICLPQGLCHGLAQAFDCQPEPASLPNPKEHMDVIGHNHVSANGISGRLDLLRSHQESAMGFFARQEGLAIPGVESNEVQRRIVPDKDHRQSRRLAPLARSIVFHDHFLPQSAPQPARPGDLCATPWRYYIRGRMAQRATRFL